MKPPRSPHTPSPGDPEEDLADLSQDAELWDLLGKADKPTSVSPFFARNVVREVRLAEARKAEQGLGGVLRSLLARWRGVATGAAAAAVVTLGALMALSSGPESTGPQTVSITTANDLEIIVQLDELVDEESIWLESYASAY